MHLDDLSLRPYARALLEELHSRTPLKGKTVLEIGADTSFQMAQGMLCLGAEHVWAVNPAFPDDALSPDPGISCLRTLGEQTSLPDSCADIIWGNALLEHVHDPAALARECRRLLSSRGECFLQGNPLWTSDHGHHIICTAPSGASYRCSDKSVPFAPWEHLLLHDEQQAAGILRSRNVPEEDIKLLVHLILHDRYISRIPPEKIISSFDLEGMQTEVSRRMFGPSPNECYRQALSQFPEEDLRTTDLQIRMIHAGGPQRPLYVSLGPVMLPGTFLRQGGLRSLTMRSPDCLPFDFCTLRPESLLTLLRTDFKDFARHLEYNASKGFWENSLLKIAFNGDKDCPADARMQMELRLQHRIANFHQAMRQQRPVIFIFSAYQKTEEPILSRIRDCLSAWRGDRPHKLLIWGQDAALRNLENKHCAVCLVPYAVEALSGGITSDALSSGEGQAMLEQLVAHTRRHAQQLC